MRMGSKNIFRMWRDKACEYCQKNVFFASSGLNRKNNFFEFCQKLRELLPGKKQGGKKP